AIFFKDPAFQSEEEYRIAYKNTSGTMHSAVRFRAQNGVITPFITVDFEERLPISHITIGPKHNIDIAKRGIEHYLNSKGYSLERLYINKAVAALRYRVEIRKERLDVSGCSGETGNSHRCFKRTWQRNRRTFRKKNR